MFVLRMRPWVSLTIASILCLTLTLNNVTEANDAILIGTVYCDTCFHQHFSPISHFISGALVAVECGGDDEMEASGGNPRFREEVKTDVKGEFKVILPFLATEHADEIKRCSVKLVSSSEPDCALASVSADTATSSSIRVKMKTSEYHVYTSGFFTFQPLEQPKRCQHESHANSNDEIIASTPLPSPIVDGMLAPIPSITEWNPTGVELHELAYEKNLGSSYHVNHRNPTFPSQLPPGFRFIPEVPPPPGFRGFGFNTGFQSPPPDFKFNTGFQSPPQDSVINPGFHSPPQDSMINPGFQTPSQDSMINPGFQSPPQDSMITPGFQSPPQDSIINPGFQSPPQDSMITPGFQSPSQDSMINPGFQSPPQDSMINPGFQSPPPDSMLNPNPLQPPPDSTFDPSPPSLTPQLRIPPSPPPPSLPNPSLDPQPDLIQATPPPPFNPSFPAFPFQPSAGLPRMPPATNKPPLLYN